MRLIIAIGAAFLVIGIVSASAAQDQDDLTWFLRDKLLPTITMSFTDTPVDRVLSKLANAGGFDVYFSVQVQDLRPVTLEFRHADYEDALRSVLKTTGLRHTVVGDKVLLISLHSGSAWAGVLPPRGVEQQRVLSDCLKRQLALDSDSARASL